MIIRTKSAAKAARAMAHVASCFGLFIAVITAGHSLASEPPYPARNVRIITAGAGTFHDIVTRQLAQRLSERWQQAVVVDNQPAAALTIGTAMAARAAPDGYTLVMSDRSALAVAPHLYKNVPYDSVKDLAPVTLVGLSPSMLVVHPSVPVSTLAEFVALSKQRTGGIDFATAGAGTNNHVAMEVFKQASGLDLVPIHYKGGGASALAMLSGEVKAGFSLLPSGLPQVRAGKLKALLISGRERFPDLPDVPTAAEAGFPGLELDFWIGVLAPAQTPAAVIARLNRDIGDILRTPEMQAVMRAQGVVPASGSPEAFASYIEAESAKMKKLVERTGMRVD